MALATLGDGSARSRGRESGATRAAVRRSRSVSDLGGLGSTDQIALREIAVERRKSTPDLGALDSLGDDVEAEVPGEIDRRADDRRVVRIVDHVGDEGAVDLELVDGQALEVRERRVAGAEVVDGKPDARLAEHREHLAGTERVSHEGALGDLELETAGLDAPAMEKSDHVVREVEIEQVRDGDVDGHVNPDPLVSPCPPLPEGSLGDVR